MAKVVFIIADAISFEVAVRQCGNFEGMVDAGRARRWRMRSELPSTSLPVYETLHTGQSPQDHGVLLNDNVPPSAVPNVFSEARAAGLRTAAVAHYNFSELYNGASYEPLRDHEYDDDARPVRHGRFYGEHGETSFNLCLPSERDLAAKASILIRRHAPDYILLHTFSADSVGHVHGGESKEFGKQVGLIENAIMEFLPGWLAEGYRVLFTADHGMTALGLHGGTTEVERYVPFYDFGHPEGGAMSEAASQLNVAPTILTLMGLTPPASMKAPPL